MRYHFDVASPRGVARDDEGQEFTSDAAASKEAVLSARELASERVLLGEPLADWAIIMRDAGERIAQTLWLTNIVLEPKPWLASGSNHTTVHTG
jgi:hypothetical protein